MPVSQGGSLTMTVFQRVRWCGMLGASRICLPTQGFSCSFDRAIVTAARRINRIIFAYSLVSTARRTHIVGMALPRPCLLRRLAKRSAAPS